jgi:sirohydrochlorin ferrochelatase
MGLGRQVIYPANPSPVHNVERPHCFLFDNGSLRPSSTLSLRRTAKALQAQINVPVHAVSLLHSTGVPASELEGEPAELLEPALVKWLTENPAGQAVVLPFFFGPSAALTEYVPERLDAVRAKFPQSKIRLAHCLVDPAVEADTRIALRSPTPRAVS